MLHAPCHCSVENLLLSEDSRAPMIGEGCRSTTFPMALSVEFIPAAVTSVVED